MDAGCDYQHLAHEFHGEVVDHVTGLQNFAVDGEKYGLCLVSTQKGVDGTADNDVFTAGTHGADQIGKGMIEINDQLGSVLAQAVDGDTLFEYTGSDQLLDHNSLVDFGNGNLLGKELFGVVVTVVEGKGNQGRFGGCVRRGMGSRRRGGCNCGHGCFGRACGQQKAAQQKHQYLFH